MGSVCEKMDSAANEPALVPARWPRKIESTPWTDSVARELGVTPPAADDPIFDRLKSALLSKDDLADNLAGWVKGEPGNRDLFNRLLDEGPDAIGPMPKPLADFSEAILDKRPAWADPAKIKLGGETHLRLSTAGQLASASLGLLEGYRSAAVAKSLVTTGSLTVSSGRRLAETAKFATDVITSNGMTRFSDGFKATARVRLVHSFVRHGLSRSPRWREDLWGMPISILDSLGTTFAFWVPVVRAAPVFGYSVSREEAEGMMTLWNYVGWIQGVPDELLPQTLEESYRVYVAVLMLIGEPDEDSRALAAAYMDVAEQKGDKKSWLQGRLVRGAAAALISRKHMDELGLKTTLFRYWPGLMRPLVQRQERRRMSDPVFHAELIEKGRFQAIQSLPRDLRQDHAYDPNQVVHDQSAFGA